MQSRDADTQTRRSQRYTFPRCPEPGTVLPMTHGMALILVIAVCVIAFCELVKLLRTL